MELTQNVNEWLNWLARVRILVITLLLCTVLLLRQYSLLAVQTRHFVPLIVLWYALGILDALLLQLVAPRPLARAAASWCATS